MEQIYNTVQSPITPTSSAGFNTTGLDISGMSVTPAVKKRRESFHADVEISDSDSDAELDLPKVDYPDAIVVDESIINVEDSLNTTSGEVELIDSHAKQELEAPVVTNEQDANNMPMETNDELANADTGENSQDTSLATTDVNNVNTSVEQHSIDRTMHSIDDAESKLDESLESKLNMSLDCVIHGHHLQKVHHQLQAHADMKEHIELFQNFDLTPAPPSPSPSPKVENLFTSNIDINAMALTMMQYVSGKLALDITNTGEALRSEWDEDGGKWKVKSIGNPSTKMTHKIKKALARLRPKPLQDSITRATDHHSIFATSKSSKNRAITKLKKRARRLRLHCVTLTRAKQISVDFTQKLMANASMGDTFIKMAADEREEFKRKYLKTQHELDNFTKTANDEIVKLRSDKLMKEQSLLQKDERMLMMEEHFKKIERDRINAEQRHAEEKMLMETTHATEYKRMAKHADTLVTTNQDLRIQVAVHEDEMNSMQAKCERAATKLTNDKTQTIIDMTAAHQLTLDKHITHAAEQDFTIEKMKREAQNILTNHSNLALADLNEAVAARDDAVNKCTNAQAQIAFLTGKLHNAEDRILTLTHNNGPNQESLDAHVLIAKYKKKIDILKLNQLKYRDCVSDQVEAINKWKQQAHSDNQKIANLAEKLRQAEHHTEALTATAAMSTTIKDELEYANKDRETLTAKVIKYESDVDQARDERQEAWSEVDNIRRKYNAANTTINDMTEENRILAERIRLITATTNADGIATLAVNNHSMPAQQVPIDDDDDDYELDVTADSFIDEAAIVARAERDRAIVERDEANRKLQLQKEQFSTVLNHDEPKIEMTAFPVNASTLTHPTNPAQTVDKSASFSNQINVKPVPGVFTQDRLDYTNVNNITWLKKVNGMLSSFVTTIVAHTPSNPAGRKFAQKVVDTVTNKYSEYRQLDLRERTDLTALEMPILTDAETVVNDIFQPYYHEYFRKETDSERLVEDLEVAGWRQLPISAVFYDICLRGYTNTPAQRKAIREQAKKLTVAKMTELGPAMARWIKLQEHVTKSLNIAATPVQDLWDILQTATARFTEKFGRELADDLLAYRRKHHLSADNPTLHESDPDERAEAWGRIKDFVIFLAGLAQVHNNKNDMNASSHAANEDPLAKVQKEMEKLKTAHAAQVAEQAKSFKAMEARVMQTNTHDNANTNNGNNSNKQPGGGTGGNDTKTFRVGAGVAARAKNPELVPYPKRGGRLQGVVASGSKRRDARTDFDTSWQIKPDTAADAICKREFGDKWTSGVSMVSCITQDINGHMGLEVGERVSFEISLEQSDPSHFKTYAKRVKVTSGRPSNLKPDLLAEICTQCKKTGHNRRNCVEPDRTAQLAYTCHVVAEMAYEAPPTLTTSSSSTDTNAFAPILNWSEAVLNACANNATGDFSQVGGASHVTLEMEHNDNLTTDTTTTTDAATVPFNDKIDDGQTWAPWGHAGPMMTLGHQSEYVTTISWKNGYDFLACGETEVTDDGVSGNHTINTMTPENAAVDGFDALTHDQPSGMTDMFFKTIAAACELDINGGRATDENNDEPDDAGFEMTTEDTLKSVMADETYPRSVRERIRRYHGDVDKKEDGVQGPKHDDASPTDSSSNDASPLFR